MSKCLTFCDDVLVFYYSAGILALATSILGGMRTRMYGPANKQQHTWPELLHLVIHAKDTWRAGTVASKATNPHHLLECCLIRGGP